MSHLPPKPSNSSSTGRDDWYSDRERDYRSRRSSPPRARDPYVPPRGAASPYSRRDSYAPHARGRDDRGADRYPDHSRSTSNRPYPPYPDNWRSSDGRRGRGYGRGDRSHGSDRHGGREGHPRTSRSSYNRRSPPRSRSRSPPRRRSSSSRRRRSPTPRSPSLRRHRSPSLSRSPSPSVPHRLPPSRDVLMQRPSPTRHESPEYGLSHSHTSRKRFSDQSDHRPRHYSSSPIRTPPPAPAETSLPMRRPGSPPSVSHPQEPVFPKPQAPGSSPTRVAASSSPFQETLLEMSLDAPSPSSATSKQWSKEEFHTEAGKVQGNMNFNDPAPSGDGEGAGVKIESVDTNGDIQMAGMPSPAPQLSLANSLSPVVPSQSAHGRVSSSTPDTHRSLPANLRPRSSSPILSKTQAPPAPNAVAQEPQPDPVDIPEVSQAVREASSDVHRNAAPPQEQRGATAPSPLPSPPPSPVSMSLKTEWDQYHMTKEEFEAQTKMEERKRKEKEKFDHSMTRYHTNNLTYWSSIGEFRTKTEQARHELDMALLEYSMISRRRIAADEVYEKARAGVLCDDLDLSDPE